MKKYGGKRWIGLFLAIILLLQPQLMYISAEEAVLTSGESEGVNRKEEVSEIDLSEEQLSSEITSSTLSSELPIPTPTPEEAPTPMPEETPTPMPEETPTPMPEETPTPMPEETPTPMPEETPTPTPEETPTPTPTSEERTEAMDWSSSKEVNYVLTDIFNPEDGNSLNRQIRIDLYWNADTGRGILSGDTLSFEIPQQWMKADNTDTPVPVYAGDRENVGHKEQEPEKKNQVASYTIADQKLKLTFLDSVKEIEDITSVFFCLKFQIELNEEVLGKEPQNVSWDICTYADGTKQTLMILLPSKEEAPTPTPTPTPEATEAPTPTPTPEMTEAPTPTPEVTEAPTPTPTPEERTETMDWSSSKEVNYVLADIFNPENGNSLNRQVRIDLYWNADTGQRVLPGDTLSFEIPQQWMKTDNTDTPVSVQTGEWEASGNKTRNKTLEPVKLNPTASYIIEDQKLKLTFLDSVEEIENITSAFFSLEFQVELNEEALGEEPQNVSWDICTYADGTKQTLMIPLPSKKEAGIAEGDESKIDAPLGQIPFSEELAVSFDKKESEALEQLIWWVDNNDTSVRYTESEYKELFIKNGSLTISFTEKNGAAETTLSVEELIKNKILTEDDITVEPYQGAYRLLVKARALPEEGYYIDGDGQKTEGSFSWTLNPPRLEGVGHAIEDISNYYFVNVTDPALFTQEQIEPGWYYIKTQAFTVNVDVRKGNHGYLAELEKALEKQLSFYYKATANAEEFTQISLGELRNLANHGTDITWKYDSTGDFYTLSIQNLPMYYVDGLERLYHLKKQNENPEEETRIDLDELGNDWLEITYENDQVGNFGSITDRAHNNGTMILTLTGEKTYHGTKVWRDEALEDKSVRPELEFRLWRYTNKGGSSYKTASPVRNQDGKGDFVKIVVPAGEKPGEDGNTVQITFIEGEQYVSAGFAEGENLPKYDSEGYEYIYFARETMTGGKANYETVFGEIRIQSDAPPEIEDTLPYGYKSEVRESTDKSIYNGGTVNNSLSANVDTIAEKRWEAASFQDEFKNVSVEMALEFMPNGGKQWFPCKDEKTGKEITVKLDGFTAEQLTRRAEKNMPKYGVLGSERKYRWVEKAVYQGDKRIEVGADGDFQLNHNGQQVSYCSEQEEVKDTQGKVLYTRTVNRLKDTVNYIVDKKWEDEDENDISHEMEGKESVTLALEYKNHLADVEILDSSFVLDGNAETEWTKKEVVYKNEGKENKVTIEYCETKPWHLEIRHLSKYDSEGHIFDYMVLETNKSEEWKPLYSTEYKDQENTYYTKITNVPTGEGKSIYVRKDWIDDSDVQHRGEVSVTVYQYNKDEDICIPLEKEDGSYYTSVLNPQNFWWDEIKIPNGVDLGNLFIVETQVGDKTFGPDTETSEKYDYKYTQEQLKNFYEAQRTTEGSSKMYEYETDQHLYRQYYSKKISAGGKEFYTITNQRLGLIHLTATKYWRDGDGKKRKELEKELQDKGYGLYLRLSCKEYPNAIDYEKNTIMIGKEGQDKPFPIKGEKYEENKKALQEVVFDSKGTRQHDYYFWYLPKYDLRGNVVHYQIEEVVMKPEEITDSKKIKNALTLTQAKAQNWIETEYSATVIDHGYVTGLQHTNDYQKFEVSNRLTGTKKVIFYKQWLDDYRYGMGERPDIALNIYQLKHKMEKTEGGDAEELMWELSLYYKDFKWDKVSEIQDSSQEGTEIWKAELTGLPQYDSEGYEIFYYGEETMVVDAAAFDYRPVYYKHFPIMGNGSEAIGDESGKAGILTDEDAAKILITDVNLPAAEGNEKAGALCKNKEGIHFLQEGGTFVNQIRENVRVEGKKLWKMGGIRLSEAMLPKVTFKVYQKTKPDALTQEEIKKKTEIASVTISDWSSVKKDGSYLFGMVFQGENKNEVKNGRLVITDHNGKQEGDAGAAEILPQYDKNGKMYYYEVVEELAELPTKESGIAGDSPEAAESWEDVYAQPVVNGYLISNIYKSAKSSLKVKKIVNVELDQDLDGNPNIDEKYPNVSFTLTRKYKDSNGEYVFDEGFSKTSVIKSSDFQKGKGTDYATFTNLEIYAPNGWKYQYVIKENTGEFGGYKVYSEKGDYKKEHFNGKSENHTVEGIYLEQAQEAETSFLKSVTDSVRSLFVEKPADVTFLNDYEPEKVKLTGNKLWEDSNNISKARPEIKEGAITLTVRRRSGNSSSETFINWHNVPNQESLLTIKWEDKSEEKGRDYWVYTIEGRTESTELEKYAPNGLPWEYQVIEEVEEPYKSYYQNAVSAGQKSAEGDTITMADLMNRLIVDVEVQKEWKRGDSPETITKTYLEDYEAEVDFQLQARVKAVYKRDGTETKKNSEWMNADELYNEIGMPFETVYPGAGQVNTTATTKRQSILNGTAEKWKKTFSGLLTSLEAQKECPNIGAGKGDIVNLVYRVTETEVRYYKKGENTPVYRQEYTLKDNKEENPTYILTPVNSPFSEVIQTTDRETNVRVPKVTITNIMQTSGLLIKKIWKDDGNNKDTRGDVYFVIQRKVKGNTSAQWEIVEETAKNGKPVDCVRKLPSGSEVIKITDLPKYDFIQTDGEYKAVEYEYRARELRALDKGEIQWGAGHPIDAEEDIISDKGGKFRDIYEVVQEDKGEQIIDGIRFDYSSEITNTLNQQKGSITLEKKDEAGTALAGVVFQIKWREKKEQGGEYQTLTEDVCKNLDIIQGQYKDDSGKIIPGTVITGENGRAVFDELILPADINKSYEYEITELKTKAGYNILAEPIYAELPYVTEGVREDRTEPYQTVKKEGKIYNYYKDITITISNNKAFVMPTTAGPGFFRPGMAGLFVVFAGGGMYIFYEEKKRRKGMK